MNEERDSIFTEAYRMALGRSGTKNGSDRVAFSLFKKAAILGHARAQFYVGVFYEHGRGVKANLRRAMYWYLKAASKGHSVAQYNLGFSYKHGHGVRMNHRRAVEWFRKAADQGDTDAIRDLGYCYHEGEGVEQDDRMAMRLYKIAARKGDDKALYNLGIMYQYGQGVQPDHAKARIYFKKAVQHGNAGASFRLEGLKRSDRRQLSKRQLAESIEIIRKAARKGYAPAIHEMGYCYYFGIGTTQNKKAAFRNFLKAAELGEPDAMQALGYMIKRGEGISNDYVNSAKWVARAKRNGIRDFDSIESQLA